MTAKSEFQIARAPKVLIGISQNLDVNSVLCVNETVV